MTDKTYFAVRVTSWRMDVDYFTLGGMTRDDAERRITHLEAIDRDIYGCTPYSYTITIMEDGRPIALS